MVASGRKQPLCFVKNLFCVLLDVCDSVANSANLLSLVVGDRDTELLLELHDELYGIQRVCTEVVSETCFGLNLCFINTEFVYDNSLT